MRGLALPGVTRRGAERTEEVGVLLSHPLTGWDQPNHPVLTNWTLGKLCSGTPNQRATRFNSSGHPPNCTTVLELELLLARNALEGIDSRNLELSSRTHSHRDQDYIRLP